MDYPDHHQLFAYKKAKELTIQIILLAQKSQDKNLFSIYNQIVRSSSSIGANIAEGYGRNNTKEYRQFLGIARGSSFETEYWLEILQESTSTSFSNLVELNKEIIKLLTVNIRQMSKQPVL
jgi:four helix bundle protein